eukprot:gnl/TRDRNA2_/TRDRNA2_93653_c0_seq1.p1 gnl/TRDRNA2_/TRDRNA2_93653_c0~~gnl/TRDRNA2_/TRDRNA2_93653_c0_seq1.p1  ORF type:complete len:391 (+),score=44.65 gnl/TRDRNA2_/TRDRNA2_93653_c0_seq1:147-1175(+)
MASLVLDASPRFAMSTPPAPSVILQGWWWPTELTKKYEGLLVGGGDKHSNVDFGTQIVLHHSQILTHRRGLLLVDVGTYDGSSLLSIGLRAGMNHSVIAFEPLLANRKLVINHFGNKGMLHSLRMLDPDAKTCGCVFPNGRIGTCSCKCQRGYACGTLVAAGLSAVDHQDYVEVVGNGAFTSVSMKSWGGEADMDHSLESSVRLREGMPIVGWWAREALGHSCLDIHLMSIDVEGSEFNVLRGFEPVFAEHRVHFVFIEVWPVALMTWGVKPLAFLRWLAHYGFLCRFLGAHVGPESFEDFVARHTSERQMSDYTMQSMGTNDLLCEDQYWNYPCGREQEDK